MSFAHCRWIMIATTSASFASYYSKDCMAQLPEQEILLRNAMTAPFEIRVLSDQRKSLGSRASILTVEAGKVGKLILRSAGPFEVEIVGLDDDSGVAPLGRLDLRFLATIAHGKPVQVKGIFRSLDCQKCGKRHQKRVAIYLETTLANNGERQIVASADVLEPVVGRDGVVHYQSRNWQGMNSPVWRDAEQVEQAGYLDDLSAPPAPAPTVDVPAPAAER